MRLDELAELAVIVATLIIIGAVLATDELAVEQRGTVLAAGVGLLVFLARVRRRDRPE